MTVSVAAIFGGVWLIAVTWLLKRSRAHRYHATSFVDAHPSFLSWGVLTLVGLAVGLGLLAVLDLLIDDEPMRSPRLIASFVAVVPLLLGFREPVFPLFVEEEGAWKVVAAVVLWASLTAIAFWLRPGRPGASRWEGRSSPSSSPSSSR